MSTSAPNTSLPPLSRMDVMLLMEVQYRFPVSREPFREIAGRLGLSVGEVLARLRQYKGAGLLKRIGFYVNYRSQGMVAALVGYRVPEESIGMLRGLVEEDPGVSHAYLRTHPRYNAWIVAKKPSMRELADYASKLAGKIGAEDYVVLPSVRTYKLSVKYDLLRGVSWSMPQTPIPSTPSIGSLEVDPGVIRMLGSLPLAERPFRILASKTEMGEDELVRLAEELLARGILGDPGASLNGEKLGFRYNAMVAAACIDCCRLAAGIPETTHVVLRRAVKGAWMNPCFMVIHARSRGISEETISRIRNALGNPPVEVLYSVENLKPGAVR